MLQTAQGGIQQIGNILTQLKQVATEAASSNTDASDLGALQTQVTQLETEINNIATTTQYGGTRLLQGANTLTGGETQAQQQAGIDNINVSSAPTGAYGLSMTLGTGGVTLTLGNGTTTQTMFVTTTTMSPGTDQTVNFNNLGISLQVNSTLTAMAATQTLTVAAGTSSFTYQVGSENALVDQITVGIANFNTTGSVLNLSALGQDVDTQAHAQAFMFTLDTAVNNLNTQEGSVGATQNEISYQVANMQSMNTNTQSAESTIKDTNYASAMSNFTQSQVAEQASVAMLTQANALPQQILALIKG